MRTDVSADRANISGWTADHPWRDGFPSRPQIIKGGMTAARARKAVLCLLEHAPRRTMFAICMAIKITDFDALGRPRESFLNEQQRKYICHIIHELVRGGRVREVKRRNGAKPVYLLVVQQRGKGSSRAKYSSITHQGKLLSIRDIYNMSENMSAEGAMMSIHTISRRLKEGKTVVQILGEMAMKKSKLNNQVQTGSKTDETILRQFRFKAAKYEVQHNAPSARAVSDVFEGDWGDSLGNPILTMNEIFMAVSLNGMTAPSGREMEGEDTPWAVPVGTA